MLKEITSIQNPCVKYILKLKEKPKYRDSKGVFVIEGQRELKLAIEGGYKIISLYLHKDFCKDNRFNKYASQFTEILKISSKIYKKIAYRGSTEGIIAIAKNKSHLLTDLKLPKYNPLVMVAESPEKPGNIGALLRTADAAKVDAVIIANPRTDLYNPNVIRSSVGGIFTVPVALASTNEAIHFLQIHEISIYSAVLQKSVVYDTVDFCGPSAVVLGTESIGLSKSWQIAASQNIKIPMLGQLDSMNVSVAAGILLFEAKRQRKFIS